MLENQDHLCIIYGLFSFSDKSLAFQQVWPFCLNLEQCKFTFIWNIFFHLKYPKFLLHMKGIFLF